MTDKTTLRLEYKKFNTFLSDYLRSISRGWIFMKMKHKYPMGTELTFLITVTGIDRVLSVTGTVVHHGTDDEGREGIGLRLAPGEESAGILRRVVEERCRDLFGERIAGRIMAAAGAGGDAGR